MNEPYNTIHVKSFPEFKGPSILRGGKLNFKSHVWEYNIDLFFVRLAAFPPVLFFANLWFVLYKWRKGVSSNLKKLKHFTFEIYLKVGKNL